MASQSWPEGLREKLEALRVELSERVERIKADIGRGLEADSKEQAAQLENKEVLDALANEAEAELKKISTALQRMDAGNYGVCTDCGSEISPARLEVRPYSLRCINCAE